jgi:hypothetical protein
MRLNNRVKMPALILKRAATSRPSGKWNEDDYDVLADGDRRTRQFSSRYCCTRLFPISLSMVTSGRGVQHGEDLG